MSFRENETENCKKGPDHPNALHVRENQKEEHEKSRICNESVRHILPSVHSNFHATSLLTKI